MNESFFSCEREGLTIRGMQFLPAAFEEGRQYPAIIFSHGFTGNYQHMIPFCKDFAKEGYVTFCFNFCGGGCLHDADAMTSDGKTTDMTAFSEVKDLTAVMEYAKSLPFVDCENLILAGASQGGFVSGLTAAQHDGEVSRLIMIFPALCIPDHARQGHLGGASYDPACVPETIDCGRTVLGRKFHEEMAALDPFLTLSAYHGPVLILHGLADKTVNYSYSIRAKENYQKGQCQLQLIRDMGHSTDGKYHESTVAAIRQFLNKREEILCIQVIITHCENTVEGEIRKSNIYFTGYCETPYFRGAIIPEGCDAQEYCGEIQTKIRAEYTLEGLDKNGEHCHIHIVNQRGEKDWEPIIKTDSRALSWLNDTSLTAVLEYGKDCLTVRIFAVPQ